jgi:hypothetical protein
MTHPVYSQTTLEAMTVAELKTIANQLGAIPDGDKRSKQTWVAAIIDHQTKFSPAKVAAMSAHIETVMARGESVTPDTSDVPSESPTIDTYVPTPRTHADDVAFASAMGLTYDDVFGEPMSDEQEFEYELGQHEAEGEIPLEQPLTAPSKKLGASIVLIALAAILYAVCMVPIGLGIVIYRSIRWGRSRFTNLTQPSGISRHPSIDYFPFPA